MKRQTLIVLFSLFVSLLMINSVNGQILKRIKERVKQTAENRAVNKAGDATNKALDKVEESARQNKGENDKESDTLHDKEKVATGNQIEVSDGSLQAYKNYDFVPGDKIIYYYDMAGEADAEIPGRLLINTGNAEVQTYKGEKVLVVPGEGSVMMMPQMTGDSYLPEQFTIEFGILANGKDNYTGSSVSLYFREKDAGVGNQGRSLAPIIINLAQISGEKSQPKYGFTIDKDNKTYGVNYEDFPAQAVDPTQDNWRQVAIYVNKNIGKLYVDQYRIGVVNQIVPGKATKVEFKVKSQKNPVLFRNFRIAAGGADAYNKVETEGKIISYGIQFDVNKSTLKPESMGAINEIVKLMKQNEDLRFEIGGHTDNTGTTDRNNILSQERADAVKNQMVKMGIDEGRLTTKGYGLSKPVAKNDNAENKARNRRVEFIKL